MKNKFLTLTAIFASLVLFTSCGGKEPTPPPPSGLTSLTVTIDKYTLLDTSADSFNFTATGDDGVDYTATAEFFVNGTKISGHSFPAAGNQGNHTVYARVGNVQSPPRAFLVIGEDYEFQLITLSASTLMPQAGVGVNFTAIGKERGTPNTHDISNLITLFVNGTSVGNVSSYTFPAAGTYSVYAKFGPVSSNTLTVKAVSELPSAFVHKVLIEDFTGTWCVWCTRVLNGIDELHKLTDKVVVAAIHCNPGSADFMALPESTAWLAPFGVTGLPTARINRSESWRAIPAYSYRDMDLSHPMDMVQESCNYGIAIASTMGASGGTIDVSYYFGTAVASAKCMIYVLEDGLVHDQDNAYTGAGGLYGGVSVIRNFVHNDVVRASVTNILGDNIPASNSAAKATFNKRFSAVYSSSNVDNLKVMAMLLDSGGRVLNVQVAPANEVKEFETK